jgi:fermentation-respiration switch protein FrsA (DUF1100 family)
MTKDKYDSAAKVGAVTAPLLVVHGERDAIIPPRFGRRLVAAAPTGTTVRIIDAAGHNDLYNHGAAEVILEFLNGLPAGD